MKIWVDDDELYPVYTVFDTPQALSVELSVPKDVYDRVKRASDEFYTTQRLISKYRKEQHKELEYVG